MASQRSGQLTVLPFFAVDVLYVRSAFTALKLSSRKSVVSFRGPAGHSSRRRQRPPSWVADRHDGGLRFGTLLHGNQQGVQRQLLGAGPRRGLRFCDFGQKTLLRILQTGEAGARLKGDSRVGGEGHYLVLRDGEHGVLKKLRGYVVRETIFVGEEIR